MAPVLPSAASAAAICEKGFWNSSPARPAPPAWSADEAAVAAVSISRSTSAGSTTPRSSGDESPGGKLSSRSTPIASSSLGLGLPELQENVPFVIYNTFINTVPEQDPSFDLEGFFAERQVQSCPASPYRELAKTVQDETQLSVTAQAAESVPRVLRLADSLQELPSSLDMPSAGSEGHAQGMCKPCAFVHTKGCGNGKNCVFCHLCDAGARKRRQKERMIRWRDACPDEMPWTPQA